MKRLLLSLWLAIGLLLTLTVAALWVWSFFASIGFLMERVHVEGTRQEGFNILATFTWNRVGAGWISFSQTRTPDNAMEPSFVWSVNTAEHDPFALRGSDRNSPWERLGFVFERHPPDPSGWSDGTVAIPSWLAIACAALLTAPPVLLALRVRRRRRRLARGLCPACGHDLRGAEHERCPECGELVAAPGRV